MAGIKILGTGRFLPEKTVSNNDFTVIVDTTDEWISTRTGMSVRHFASVGEPTWHMGAKAAETALLTAEISAKDLDMILVTTVTPDYVTPSTACLIGRAIGAENIIAMDINVACSGLAYALDIARRYLLDGDVRHILIVCAETLTRITNFADRSTCVLFGDGAGAVVLTGADKRFGSYLSSDVSGAHLIYAKAPSGKAPFLDDGIEPLEPFPSPTPQGIYMNGREVYKFATAIMPEAVLKACAKLGVTPAELAVIIPHQANYRIIETAAKNLGVPMEKIHVNIQNYGNTSSATIAIGLDELLREGKIKRGELICVVGFGAGLTYAASIFEY